LGRNAFRGPTRTNFDLSIAKMTNIGESRKLEFRAEMFNAFNRALWQSAELDHKRDVRPDFQHRQFNRFATPV